MRTHRYKATGTKVQVQSHFKIVRTNAVPVQSVDDPHRSYAHVDTKSLYDLCYLDNDMINITIGL